MKAEYERITGVLPFRWRLLMQSIPDLLQPPGRCLYVGASKARFACGRELRWAGWEITLLEAWPENAEFYRGHPWISEVVQADVRYMPEPSHPFTRVQLALWWHGPEHVSKADLPRVLGNLEAIAGRVVLSCPWGRYVQGAYGGNPYEEHKSHLYPKDFEALGYQTATAGRENGERASALIAWKETR